MAPAFQGIDTQNVQNYWQKEGITQVSHKQGIIIIISQSMWYWLRFKALTVKMRLLFCYWLLTILRISAVFFHPGISSKSLFNVQVPILMEKKPNKHALHQKKPKGLVQFKALLAGQWSCILHILCLKRIAKFVDWPLGTIITLSNTTAWGWRELVVCSHNSKSDVLFSLTFDSFYCQRGRK